MKFTSFLTGIFFSIIIFGSTSMAVELKEGVRFDITDVNTTYFIGQNMSVNEIRITPTLLNITNSSSGDLILYAKPSSGSINITILEFDTSHKKFNVTNNTPGINVDFVIGSFTNNGEAEIRENDVLFKTVIPNSSSYINFTYDGGFSIITFEIDLVYFNGESCSANSECSSDYCVHGICRSSSTYCGDDYCDSGETCSSCENDCGCSSGYICSGGSCIRTSGGGSGTKTHPVKSHIWSKITPGAAKIMHVNGPETGLKQIQITVNKPVNNVKLIVRNIERKPNHVKKIPGRVYKYIEIEKSNLEDEDIDKAKVNFQVSKIWLNENNIDKKKIFLRRFRSKIWEKLPTIRLSEDEDYVYYEAETNGFSLFAIVVEEEIESGTTSITTKVTEDRLTTTTQPKAIGENPLITQKGKGKWFIVLLTLLIIIFVTWKFELLSEIKGLYENLKKPIKTEKNII